MNLFLYFFMLFTFISYVSFIWIKYGVQPSISESYYRLPKNFNFLFTLFCWGFSFPVVILAISTTPLFFFAGVGIALVGAAAQFKDEWVGKFHYYAAVIGVIFSQLGIFLGLHLPYLSLASICVIAYAFFLKNKIWWIEMISFTATALALLKLL